MKNGQVIGDVFISYLEQHSGINPFPDDLKETINDCASKSAKDRCETAGNFFTCFLAVAQNAESSLLKMFMPTKL